MEFYHHNVRLVQRSKGQNAIASAAYIAGLCLQKLDGTQADYRQKKGVCGHKIIMPSRYADMPTPSAQELWTLAENTDNRKNSITARRADLALPKDFTEQESLEVGYKYAQDLTDRYSVLTQIDFHDLGTNNPHIDMQFTTREFDGEKLTKKTRILDQKQTGVGEIKWMREQFAKRINEVLSKYGKQVDHRSYKDQGIEKLPTKHLGRKNTALERKGIKTNRGKYNAIVREHNILIDEKEQCNKEIAELELQLKEQNYESRQSEPTNEKSGITSLSRGNSDLGWPTDAAIQGNSEYCNDNTASSSPPRQKQIGNSLRQNHDTTGTMYENLPNSKKPTTIAKKDIEFGNDSRISNQMQGGTRCDDKPPHNCDERFTRGNIHEAGQSFTGKSEAQRGNNKLYSIHPQGIRKTSRLFGGTQDYVSIVSPEIITNPTEIQSQYKKLKARAAKLDETCTLVQFHAILRTVERFLLEHHLQQGLITTTKPSLALCEIIARKIHQKADEVSVKATLAHLNRLLTPKKPKRVLETLADVISPDSMHKCTDELHLTLQETIKEKEEKNYEQEEYNNNDDTNNAPS